VDERDLAAAHLAATAEGVLDVRELAACGLSPQAIVWRAQHGRLHRIHEGVYASELNRV
jgi:hypothetical protein